MKLLNFLFVMMFMVSASYATEKIVAEIKNDLIFKVSIGDKRTIVPVKLYSENGVIYEGTILCDNLSSSRAFISIDKQCKNNICKNVHLYAADKNNASRIGVSGEILTQIPSKKDVELKNIENVSKVYQKSVDEIIPQFSIKKETKVLLLPYIKNKTIQGGMFKAVVLNTVELKNNAPIPVVLSTNDGCLYTATTEYIKNSRIELNIKDQKCPDNIHNKILKNIDVYGEDGMLGLKISNENGVVLINKNRRLTIVGEIVKK